MLPAGGAQRRVCPLPPSPPSPGSRRPAREEMLAVPAKIPGRLRAFWLERVAPFRDPAGGGATRQAGRLPWKGPRSEPPRLPRVRAQRSGRCSQGSSDPL